MWQIMWLYFSPHALKFIVNTERAHQHLEAWTDVIWPVIVGVFPSVSHTRQLILLEDVHSHRIAEQPKSWSLWRRNGHFPFYQINDTWSLRTCSILVHFFTTSYPPATSWQQRSAIFLQLAMQLAREGARGCSAEGNDQTENLRISQQGLTLRKVSPRVASLLSSYLILSHDLTHIHVNPLSHKTSHSSV